MALVGAESRTIRARAGPLTRPERRAAPCRYARIAAPQRRKPALDGRDVFISPAPARTAIEAHDRTPVVDDARLGLPRVSVDDLEACLQAPIAAKVLQRRQHPLPSIAPGETPPAVDTRILRADSLQIAHQGTGIGI